MHHKNDLLYTLAKRIPNMTRGFTICTDYGNICIEADQAEPIITAVKKAIIEELNACSTNRNDKHKSS